jgi:hypothetical protein
LYLLSESILKSKWRQKHPVAQKTRLSQHHLFASASGSCSSWVNGASIAPQQPAAAAGPSGSMPMPCACAIAETSPWCSVNVRVTTGRTRRGPRDKSAGLGDRTPDCGCRPSEVGGGSLFERINGVVGLGQHQATKCGDRVEHSVAITIVASLCVCSSLGRRISRQTARGACFACNAPSPGK